MKESVDRTLALTVFALTIFGWMMVSSLSGPDSYEIFIRRGEDCTAVGMNCNSFFMWKHFSHMILGLIVCGVVSYVPYQFWKKIAPLMFGGAFMLLLAVLFSSFGADFGTIANNWLNIPGLPAFQPSEIAKIAMVAYLANWMSRRSDQIRTIREGLVPFAILTSIIVIPIISQPDFGSAMIIAISAAAIFFVAGARISHIFLGALIVMLCGGIIVANTSYIRARIDGLFNPPEDCELNQCYQTYQSLIAVSSGGATGVGYNNSRQKHNWLPEIKTDFIFAGISEELGFLRVVFVIIAYFIIAYRGFMISQNAPDRFSRLLASGLVVGITGQAFINIAINIDLLPVTGITLPLLSYGGTSLITTLWGFGILLNISRNVRPETAHITHRRRVRRTHSAKSRRLA